MVGYFDTKESIILLVLHYRTEIQEMREDVLTMFTLLNVQSAVIKKLMAAKPTLAGNGQPPRALWLEMFRKKLPKTEKMVAGEGCFLGHYFEQLLILNLIVPSLHAIDPSDDVSWGWCDHKAIEVIRRHVNSPFVVMVQED